MQFWDEEGDCLRKGTVHVNDPFIQQVTLNVEDHEATWPIRYDLLRDGPAPTPAIDEEASPEESAVEDAEPTPQPPQPKRRKIDEPEEELYSRLLEAAAEDDLVPLTYAPCANGVLKAGMTAVFGGQEFKVSK